jgi:hypothetical protein
MLMEKENKDNNYNHNTKSCSKYREISLENAIGSPLARVPMKLKRILSRRL